MAKITIIGITDEQTVCDRCGKVGLSNTVILARDGIEVGRYGSTCAGIVLAENGQNHKNLLARARRTEAVRRSRVCDAVARIVKLLDAGDYYSLAEANYHRTQIKMGLGFIQPDEIRFDRLAAAYFKAVKFHGETRTWREWVAAHS